MQLRRRVSRQVLRLAIPATVVSMALALLAQRAEALCPEVVLPAGQDEARCADEFWLANTRLSEDQPEFPLGHGGTQKLSGLGLGPFEVEIRVTLPTLATEDLEVSNQWLEVTEGEGRNNWLMISGSPSMEVSFGGTPAVGVDRWRHDEGFNGPAHGVDVDFRLEKHGCVSPILPDRWERRGTVDARCIPLLAKVKYEVVVRRARGGCRVAGHVLVPSGRTAVSGDYAFWSDNPTGLLLEEAEELVTTEEEAEETLKQVADLDAEKLASTFGLDQGQLEAAIGAAKQATAGAAGDATDQADAVAMGMAEGSGGSTFLTLQSVQGNDDVEESLGMVGSMAHILDQFTLTVELGVDFQAMKPEDLETLWGEDLPIRRAGFGYRGLKYTWPRGGGPKPIVRLGTCAEGTPGRGAVCGLVAWEGVVETSFRAGPGLFSCINN